MIAEFVVYPILVDPFGQFWQESHLVCVDVAMLRGNKKAEW